MMFMPCFALVSCQRRVQASVWAVDEESRLAAASVAGGDDGR